MEYPLLDGLIANASERKRAVDNLELLRAQLDAEVPEKDVEENLLLATWNIRDLNKKNRRGFGERLPETYFYIAEVLSRFDFVAVQEVNELDEWEKITAILGPAWDWVATDVTDGEGSYHRLGGAEPRSDAGCRQAGCIMQLA